MSPRALTVTTPHLSLAPLCPCSQASHTDGLICCHKAGKSQRDDTIGLAPRGYTHRWTSIAAASPSSVPCALFWVNRPPLPLLTLCLITNNIWTAWLNSHTTTHRCNTQAVVVIEVNRKRLNMSCKCWLGREAVLLIFFFAKTSSLLNVTYPWLSDNSTVKSEQGHFFFTLFFPSLVKTFLATLVINNFPRCYIHTLPSW